jgi:hypothetical protein
MIRLVGRYWEDGKEEDFKVNLKATIDGEPIKTGVKVVRPADLGDGFNNTRNVFDNEYSIDDLCIKYGGIYGIPPQMIKGQMATESAKKQFNFKEGPPKDGIAPSYRYEPYTRQFESAEQNLISNNNFFVVTETSMSTNGGSGVPNSMEHHHVLYTHYIETSTSMWDFIDANSQFTDGDNPSTYGYRYLGTGDDQRRKGQMKSNSYSIVRREYNKLLRPAEVEIHKKYNLLPTESLSLSRQIEANDLARENLITFFKDEYKHPNAPASTKKGLNTVIAQTRIASSYGLIQILYVSALEVGYPEGKDDRPENLNLVSNFEFSVKFLAKNFENNGFKLSDDLNNWVSNFEEVKNSDGEIVFDAADPGFEEAFSVLYYSWNPGQKDSEGNANYHTDVLDNSEQYLPRR